MPLLHMLPATKTANRSVSTRSRCEASWVCHTPASKDKYAGCARFYDWRALHLVGICYRQSDSTYAEGRKGPQAALD